MKKLFLLSALALFTFLSYTQAQAVAKTIVVEHFTNSRCGICASRNPGFYANLNQQEGVLHLAIHPSSPYNSCIFYLANPVENDARTNYYGIYGGTPRLVIEGVVISAGTNYGNASIFTPYQNQTTPVSLRIRQTKEQGMMTVSVTIKAEADNTIGDARLFLAAAEKRVVYNAPNGEGEHHDVFRKTFNGEPTGATVAVPAIAGDSLVITGMLTPDANWVFDQLYTMAILQSATDREVFQAAAAAPSDNEPLVGTFEVNELAASIFPNPVTDLLQVRLAGSEKARVRLYSTQGVLLQEQSFVGQVSLDVATYPAGIYWLEVEAAGKQAVRKIVK
ncbi:MAG: hypothetical protein DA408_09050 [Bacteroidetes bacterium]|nr:MAG: hypothetical protein C7N36_03690 [Bacteroidota bacterium]PTM12861.1 MAG: hypothetical protein DA408_09050 [Bacteroidota bacterium]